MMRVRLSRLVMVVSLLVLAATGIAMQAMPHHVLGGLTRADAMHGAPAEQASAWVHRHGAGGHGADGAQRSPDDGSPRDAPHDCPFCRIAGSWTPAPVLQIARPLTTATVIALPSPAPWRRQSAYWTYTARAPPVA